MALRSLFNQNQTYNAQDLRALIDAVGPQVIDQFGAVASGMEVTYSGNQLLVSAGVGFATDSTSATGKNYAVRNTSSATAKNTSGGSTTWAPANPGPRTDIVFIQVDDLAQGDAADGVNAYFTTNTTTLPNQSCILLARVESSGGIVPPAIRDVRRPVLNSSQIIGGLPFAVAEKTSDTLISNANTWTPLLLTTDLVDFRLFQLGLIDDWTMHRQGNSPFYAPISGWYDVGYQLRWNNKNAATTRAVSIEHGDPGTLIRRYDMSQQTESSTYAVDQNGSLVLHMDAGDAVNISAYSGTSSTVVDNVRAWCKLIAVD
jgi:hypothetical protein